MKPFEFMAARRIIFRRGAFVDVGALARELGRHAFVVTGKSHRHLDRLSPWLAAAGVAATSFQVPGEPSVDLVGRGVAAARDSACDLVIGVGGGSAIDAAKAIAALVANEGDLLDYLEVIGRAHPLRRPGLPCLAIPTTAGTGSETTRNAVLGSRDDRVKVSLRSPFLLPALAIVDPELTIDVPPAVTASTGLDALTQLIEPYVSSRANPITDAICTDGMPRAARALRLAFHDGGDIDAREQMALAALFGGLALANAGLGAVHGFAGPIGGMFDAPHGAICAALLPHVMEGNLRALEARAPGLPARSRFDEVARLLTRDSAATARDGVEWVRALVEELQIPRLREYGIASGDVDAIVANAARASSMKANPIELSAAELSEILAGAI